MTPDPDDIFNAALDALDEEQPEDVEIEGITGIQYLLARGRVSEAHRIMIDTIESQDPYTVTEKQQVAEICIDLIDQGHVDIVRPLVPYLFVIHTKTQAYLTRAAPDPVLISTVSTVVFKLDQVYDEELHFHRENIRNMALEIQKNQNTNNIPLRDVAAALGLSITPVLILVDGMISNKEIIGTYDSVGDILLLESSEYKCHVCGAIMGKDDSKCSSCNTEMLKCIVCRMYIRTTPVKCPKCNVPAHEEHFIEWLKMSAEMDKKHHRSTCPSCQNFIKREDLVV